MISGNLEYVMASLPYLTFDGSAEARSKVSTIFKKYAGPSEAEKSLTAILDDEAQKFLDTDDAHIFQQIHLATIHDSRFRESNNKVLAGFSSYVYGIKQELRELRTARRNNGNGASNDKIKVPIQLGNPLEEELQLLQLQWNEVETLCMGHYSDFSALICYKLQLLLLMRWWSFDAEKGFELFVDTTKKD